ncbi:MAG TPA: HD domain-containing phosphohydrolase [Dissulfurispiraceae bacterium]|nr:HD domain-containing phosphohydrolase [Dissulfurispiraceae bacterium]
MTPDSAENNERLYRAIDARMLAPGSRLPVDIYFRHGGQITSLFLRGTVYTGKARDIIMTKDIRGLYIRSADKAKFEEYLAEAEEGHSHPKKETQPQAEQPQKPPAFDPDDFFQIDRNALVPSSEIPFDLYIRDNGDIRLHVEASEKYPIRLSGILLAAKGDVLIDNMDLPFYREYLRQHTINLKTISDHINAKLFATMLKENSKLTVQNALKNPHSAEIIKASSEEVNAIVGAVLENRDVLYHLIDIRHYDYYTYTHSVNVAVMSIGMGINAGMSREMVQRLGIGALLHDIGKSAIRSDLINKREMLNESEFEIIKTHVQEGERLLQKHPGVSPESIAALMEHHEKLSGTGYPLGLSGAGISLPGRIASIVDSYDALITNRPYKPAFTPFYAISTLMHEKADYDSDLLKTFIEMLGRVK